MIFIKTNMKEMPTDCRDCEIFFETGCEHSHLEKKPKDCPLVESLTNPKEQTCTLCGGTGRIGRWYEVIQVTELVTKDCHRCKGTGKIKIKEMPTREEIIKIVQSILRENLCFETSFTEIGEKVADKLGFKEVGK